MWKHCLANLAGSVPMSPVRRVRGFSFMFIKTQYRLMSLHKRNINMDCRRFFGARSCFYTRLNRLRRGVNTISLQHSTVIIGSLYGGTVLQYKGYADVGKQESAMTWSWTKFISEMESGLTTKENKISKNFRNLKKFRNFEKFRKYKKFRNFKKNKYFKKIVNSNRFEKMIRNICWETRLNR